jgi:predicted porin
MQKKLIVLALAGLSAASAFAQSNVTVYGRVDYGYMSRGGNDGATVDFGRKGEMASGMQSGSRLGFKGSEDLGNGLKAIFEIESGVTNDSPGTAAGTSGLFTTNRHAYVGLTGNFGTAVGGRLDGVRYGVYNKYDAFAGGGMGNFTQMTTQVDRADNAIAYISPKFWGGFGVVAAYGTSILGQEYAGNAAVAAVANALGTVTGTTGVAAAARQRANEGDSQLYTLMGTYDNGPLSVSVDYEHIDERHINGGNNGLYVFTTGASWDFGFMKVSGVYDVLKAGRLSAIGTTDKRNWFLSAKVPYGKFDFKATYGRVDDNENSNADANKLGLGVNYNLSKRTNIYADYGTISNDRNAAYALSPAANSGGTGYGVSGINVGLAHNF